MAVSRIAYPAAFHIEEGGEITVTFRDLPGAITFGEDLDAALEAARDCLDEALSFRISRRLDVPPPSAKRRGERLVAPPALTAAKLALYIAQRMAGLTNVALAARLGCHEREVRRLLDPRHASGLERLADAIRAAGGNLELHLDLPRKSA
jgi:antitoxin HicB